jgi:hypothetical protein
MKNELLNVGDQIKTEQRFDNCCAGKCDKYAKCIRSAGVNDNGRFLYGSPTCYCSSLSCLLSYNQYYAIRAASGRGVSWLTSLTSNPVKWSSIA